MGNALHVRMTEEDYAEIQKAAGDNLSEWARKILLAEAQRIGTRPLEPRKPRDCRGLRLLRHRGHACLCRFDGQFPTLPCKRRRPWKSARRTNFLVIVFPVASRRWSSPKSNSSERSSDTARGIPTTTQP